VCLSASVQSCAHKPVVRQPGQTSVDDVKKRDLRAELLAAEAEARARKRKAAGLPAEEPEAIPKTIEAASVDGDAESNKRRKLLQEALEMDKDADSDSDSEEGDEAKDKEADMKESEKYVVKYQQLSLAHLA